jgi:hypothetical protein
MKSHFGYWEIGITWKITLPSPVKGISANLINLKPRRGLHDNSPAIHRWGEKR